MFDNITAALRALGDGGSEFRVAIRNTLIYFTKDLLMIPFQLLIAYFLHKKIAGYKFFRIVFYLPSLISGVVTVTVYSTLIATYGPVGQLLDGRPRPQNFRRHGNERKRLAKNFSR